VHDAAPVVFKSRWALSYLAGPMTREQIRQLVPRVATVFGTTEATAGPLATAPVVAPGAPAAAAPVLPPGVPQVYGAPQADGDGLVYVPAVMGTARVHMMLPEGGASTETVTLIAALAPGAGSPDWTTAASPPVAPATTDSLRPGASFAPLPASVGKTGAVSRWEKALAEAVYRSRTLTLFECKRLRMLSKPGESERDFRIRVADAGRAARDADVEKLRERYAAQLARLEERIRRAGQAVEREKDQASSQRMQTAVSMGSTLLSAFLGRKALSQSTLGRAASAARGAARAARQQRDVARAEDSLESLRSQREALEAELSADIGALEARHDAAAEVLAERTVRPRKADVEVVRAVLYWMPMRRAADGSLQPA
jgi:hypothetical protein